MGLQRMAQVPKQAGSVGVGVRTAHARDTKAQSGGVQCVAGEDVLLLKLSCPWLFWLLNSNEAMRVTAMHQLT